MPSGRVIGKDYGVFCASSKQGALTTRPLSLCGQPLHGRLFLWGCCLLLPLPSFRGTLKSAVLSSADFYFLLCSSNAHLLCQGHSCSHLSEPLAHRLLVPLRSTCLGVHSRLVGEMCNFRPGTALFYIFTASPVEWEQSQPLLPGRRELSECCRVAG